MIVRLATPADIPAIQELERQSDAAAHWGDEIYNTLFAAGGIKRIVLVADDSGVTGFIVASAIAQEWEIENVVVASNLRQRGIGSALIHELRQRAYAHHVQDIFLEVRESNTPARSFYAKAGFVECGRRIRYYRCPEEDAICYRLELSPASKSEKS